MSEIIFSPTDFVSVLNQTLDYAYPVVTIEGELANVRVSRGKWVYFDIKDDTASVKCFGTVYMLPGPIEEGMMVRIVANPRMHALYNFSLNIQSITPVGEGALKRAADLLFAKLDGEGLFDPLRKRPVPLAPTTIGLITSKESAAYADFNKILNERWGGITVLHYDVQVQGEQAIADVVQALRYMNQLAESPEVVVITRGGGSADDLAAFSTEQVVRAVAGSRIPTLVAIGHEVDTSLAELAADMRASTPSNAAQFLTPDKSQLLQDLDLHKKTLKNSLSNTLKASLQNLQQTKSMMNHLLQQSFTVAEQTVMRQHNLLQALNPQAALTRGYAALRKNGKVITSARMLKAGDDIAVQLHDGLAQATINKVDL